MTQNISWKCVIIDNKFVYILTVHDSQYIGKYHLIYNHITKTIDFLDNKRSINPLPISAELRLFITSCLITYLQQ